MHIQLDQRSQDFRDGVAYGAYDHVVMSWLWGPMVNRPNGIPMFSMDIMQWATHLDVDDSALPKQESTFHNALDDARWTRDAFHWLYDYARRAGRDAP